MNSIMEWDKVQYKGKGQAWTVQGNGTNRDSIREREKADSTRKRNKQGQYKGKGTNRDSIWENERGMKGPGSKE